MENENEQENNITVEEFVVVVSYRVSVGGAAAVAVVGNSQGRELP